MSERAALPLMSAEVGERPREEGAEREDFAAFYRAHGDYVWRCLQRLGVSGAELEDALQEVFLIAHRRLPDYDPARSRVTTWLYGIALNVTRNLRRKRLRRRETDEQTGVDGQTPEGLAQGRRTLAWLLSHLNPEQHAVFVMFELEGSSTAEIADVLGVPIGTVFSRLHHARRRLTELVRSEANEASRKGNEDG